MSPEQFRIIKEKTTSKQFLYRGNCWPKEDVASIYNNAIVIDDPESTLLKGLPQLMLCQRREGYEGE